MEGKKDDFQLGFLEDIYSVVDEIQLGLLSYRNLILGIGCSIELF